MTWLLKDTLGFAAKKKVFIGWLSKLPSLRIMLPKIWAI